MAALRYAARRLCERELHRGGAQRISPGRQSIFTSLVGAKPKPSTPGAQEELKMQYQKKKNELFDVLVELTRTGTYPSLSWKGFQVNRLMTQLSAHVEPRPYDSYWRSYRFDARLSDFTISYLFISYLYKYFWEPKEKEDGATSNNSEAKILPAGDKDLNNHMN
ncbi:hypothetical protein VPH35_011191 [Triticum aestivum]|nr:uncharacterized protein LOC123098527 [Triticum aestivum]